MVRIGLRGALATAATLAVAAWVTRVAAEPVRALGSALVTEGGVPGLLLLVVATEIVPSPLAFLPWIVLALEGGMAPAVVAATVGGGSVLAAWVDHAIGRRLGVPARWSARIEARRPDLLMLLRRRGAFAVALVGALPVPFGLVTLPAGALRVPFPAFALATLVRLPKAALFAALLSAA
jgi:membrane protein YqaA with SNARE-associated domain